MPPVISVVGLATILATVLAAAGVAYQYGRRSKRRETMQKELREAHHNVHSDLHGVIDALSAASEFDYSSSYESCDTCKKVEDDELADGLYAD